VYKFFSICLSLSLLPVASISPIRTAAFEGNTSDYIREIEEVRKKRDLQFADPITSPMAQVGGVLIEGSELLFGRSADAHLRWDGEGIESRHLRVIQDESRWFLESLEGRVLDLDSGRTVTREEWREDKMYRAGSVILVLRRHPVGPIIRILDPESRKLQNFKRLSYFPVDEKYRVRATIHPRSPKRVTISDTQGWERPGWVFGKLEFAIDERPQILDLLLFEETPTKDSAFLIMFRDQTSGNETYAACRYLSLPFQAEGEVWLDFNKATNPFCAYASSFACPLPPPGNRLNVPIRAGEKTYSRSEH
jgi:hypothetical protein